MNASLPNIAQERLTQAREDAEQGRYAEALEGFQWFWEHALEHAPSMSGVRTSFFLADWWSLAEVYAPAMQALEACCDQVERELLGSPTRELLGELSSLTERLGQPQRFASSLRTLDAYWDELELTPHNHFWGTLAIAHDWALIRRLPPSPQVELELAVEIYQLGCNYWRRRDPHDVPWESLMTEQAIRSTTKLLDTLINAQLLEQQRELCEHIAQLEHDWWIDAMIQAVRGYERQDLLDILTI